jgi:N-acetylglucosamine kinase-like BadF-type ATPase
MTYALGVDGGNTKTVALVARVDGEIVGTGRAGCGDIYGAASEEAALAEIERAVHEALAKGGVAAEELLAGGFSLAGADWPEDFTLLQAAMADRRFGRTVTVVNDAIGALRAGSDGPAVSVVCGTGVATGARGADGGYWHTSFWQEGGGSWRLTSDVFHAVVRAELGIDPPTSLSDALLTAFELPTVEAWLHAMTARRPRPPAAATIARLLLDEARAGDAVAKEIVRSEGARMGDYALAAARKVGLGDEPFDLVLAGGVFGHPSSLLPDAVVARVRASLPLARPVRATLPPAAGAVLLALDAVGVSTSPAVRDRLSESLLSRSSPR